MTLSWLLKQDHIQVLLLSSTALAKEELDIQWDKVHFGSSVRLDMVVIKGRRIAIEEDFTFWGSVPLREQCRRSRPGAWRGRFSRRFAAHCPFVGKCGSFTSPRFLATGVVVGLWAQGTASRIDPNVHRMVRVMRNTSGTLMKGGAKQWVQMWKGRRWSHKLLRTTAHVWHRRP